METEWEQKPSESLMIAGSKFIELMLKRMQKNATADDKSDPDPAGAFQKLARQGRSIGSWDAEKQQVSGDPRRPSRPPLVHTRSRMYAVPCPSGQICEPCERHDSSTQW